MTTERNTLARPAHYFFAIAFGWLGIGYALAGNTVAAILDITLLVMVWSDAVANQQFHEMKAIATRAVKMVDELLDERSSHDRT